MKITIVLGAFLPVPPIMGGAVEKAWFALGQEFARRGHNVVQISRAHSQLATTETIDGVKHLRIRGFETPSSLAWLKFLDLIYSLRAIRIIPRSDIVVTNTFWLPMLMRNRRGVYMNVARFPKGQMRFYRNASRLQAPSKAIADAIVAEVPAMKSKVTVIPYPAPSGNRPRPFSAREKKIVYVGRIHPEKGVHLLLRAKTDWKIVIVGPWEHRLGGGGEAYWKELQERARGQDQIELRGPIFDREQLAEEYQSARLFVYPSLAERGETFGLAPLEAMTNGCPVLVSDLACFHDFIRESDTGFIFDHRATDPASALQNKIVEVTANESLLARVAEAGYRRSEDFALPRVADQFIQDFEAVMKESHGRNADR